MIVEILFPGFCLVFAFAHINNCINYNEDQMGIKISELPSGVAEQNSVVPVTNQADTETVKVTLMSIASLATKQTVGLSNVDNTSDANKPVSTAVQAALNLKASSTHNHDDRYYTETEVDSLLASKQASGSYATLVDGKVPALQLPSYVDDVLEVANFASLPATGESGKIYVTLDTNKTYRWGGSAYFEISATPTLTKSDVGLGNVDNTSDADKPVSTAVQSELNTKVSSQTTGIAGATAITNIVSISQANYDALPVKNPSTLYVIT